MTQDNPIIQKAIAEILKETIRQKDEITTIKEADPSRAESYKKTLEQLEKFRGIPLWYPYIGAGKGNGALVALEDGSVKYDFISGIGVHFGHSHPDLIKACLEAAVQNTVMQGNLQQNRDSYELMELLIKESKLDHCVLTTSGAMAVENGLKLIFQKKFPAKRVLAFERCFMGRTLALSQITDKPAFREGLPSSLFVDYIPFYDWKDPIGSQQRAIATLKKHLKRYPGEHACMCFELIQGEAGFYPGNHEFFIALIEILKNHKITIFVDEVQSFGRTDSLFAFQSFGLEKEVDVVTIGKLAHVCATLYKSEYKPKPSLISQTFTSSTAAIAASKVILNSLLNENFLGREGKNMHIRKHFVNHLEQIAKRHPNRMEGPFGYGLMIAFTPYKGDKEKVLDFAQRLFQAGVMSFVAGEDPMRIRFLVPAGGVTFQDIDNVARIIEETLQ